MPPNSGEVVRRAPWPVIWIVWVVVRVVLKEMGIMTTRLILIMQIFWVRVKNLLLRRVRLVTIIWRLIRMKHGFVLMVVDHHPTDDTVASGPHHLPCSCTRHWLPY